MNQIKAWKNLHMGILYLVRHKSEVEGNGPDPTVGCYSISNPVIGIAAAIGDFWRPSAEDKQKNKKKKEEKDTRQRPSRRPLPPVDRSVCMSRRTFPRDPSVSVFRNS